MVLSHIITHGLFYGVVGTGYLFLLMITLSPRVWGYQDYPEIVKNKVPPQTRKEKTVAAIVGVPWFLFVLGFPVYSTYMLKSNLGGEIPFAIAFLNVFVMFLFFTFGDLVLLDWLVIARITPEFVIIPGSVKADYKDFTHHYKAHARAAIPITALCLIIAAVVRFV
jgi:hypothetical protein